MLLLLVPGVGMGVKDYDSTIVTAVASEYRIIRRVRRRM